MTGCIGMLFCQSGRFPIRNSISFMDTSLTYPQCTILSITVWFNYPGYKYYQNKLVFQGTIPCLPIILQSAAQSRQEIPDWRVAGKISHTFRDAIVNSLKRRRSGDFIALPLPKGSGRQRIFHLTWSRARLSGSFEGMVRGNRRRKRFYPGLLRRLNGWRNCMGGGSIFEWSRTPGVTSDNKTG